MRIVALALIAASLASPATPARAATADRVYDLLGQWTCRSSDGGTAAQMYTRHDSEIVFVDTVTPKRLSPFTVSGTLRPDAVNGGWTVNLPVNGAFGFHGTARPWEGAVWSAEGTALPPADPVAMRERYEWVAPDSYRRTVEHVTQSGVRMIGIELCRRGDSPPPAGACIVRELAGATIRPVAPVITPEIRKAKVTGVVLVIVSLDEDSNVVRAVVRSSPSPVLDASALQAAKATIFRTEVRDCKPIAADYMFSVDFSTL